MSAGAGGMGEEEISDYAEVEAFCVAFVTEQSGGEWDDKTINADAVKLATAMFAREKALRADRDALLRDRRAEVDGVMALREKYGARPNETVGMWIGRLHGDKSRSSRADELLARALHALPDAMVSQPPRTTECHGDKCREDDCESCFGDFAQSQETTGELIDNIKGFLDAHRKGGS